MLLQFTVENVLSFRDETVLSLLAEPGVEHAPGQVIEVPELGRSVLRVAAIYGANASGKSNLVKAMQKAAFLVVLGTGLGRSIDVTPFKLDPATGDGPSRFEFEVWADGCRWSYGFACTTTRILEEWLYRDDGGGEHSVFKRLAGDDDAVVLEFGDALALNEERSKFWGFVAEGTRPRVGSIAHEFEVDPWRLTPQAGPEPPAQGALLPQCALRRFTDSSISDERCSASAKRAEAGPRASHRPGGEPPTKPEGEPPAKLARGEPPAPEGERAGHQRSWPEGDARGRRPRAARP